MTVQVVNLVLPRLDFHLDLISVLLERGLAAADNLRQESVFREVEKVSVLRHLLLDTAIDTLHGGLDLLHLSLQAETAVDSFGIFSLVKLDLRVLREK